VREAILNNVTRRRKRVHIAEVLNTTRAVLAANGLLEDPEGALRSASDLLFESHFPSGKKPKPVDKETQITDLKQRWENIFGKMDDPEVKKRVHKMAESMKAKTSR
jgi:hypothetical protein